MGALKWPADYRQTGVRDLAPMVGVKFEKQGLDWYVLESNGNTLFAGQHAHAKAFMYGLWVAGQRQAKSD